MDEANDYPFRHFIPTSYCMVPQASKEFRRVSMKFPGDNVASIKLHARLGFRKIGTTQNIGCKHGRCLGVVYCNTLCTT